MVEGQGITWQWKERVAGAEAQFGVAWMSGVSTDLSQRQGQKQISCGDYRRTATASANAGSSLRSRMEKLEKNGKTRKALSEAAVICERDIITHLVRGDV